MTGNAQLDGILFLSIGVGAAVATFAGVLAAMLFYVKPKLDTAFKSVRETAKAGTEAAKSEAQSTSKQTAEDLLAAWGREHIDEMEKRVAAAERERTSLIERLDTLDAAAAVRAAKDQTTIQRLEADVKGLTTKVGVLEAERGKLMSDRDAALRRADELAKDVERLKDASSKATENIHHLEIELTKQSATNQVLQGIFDKVHWLGVQNEPIKEAGET